VSFKPTSKAERERALKKDLKDARECYARTAGALYAIGRAIHYMENELVALMIERPKKRGAGK
jgi:hypothetical protein